MFSRNNHKRGGEGRIKWRVESQRKGCTWDKGGLYSAISNGDTEGKSLKGRDPRVKKE